jgi:hypothetical protein
MAELTRARDRTGNCSASLFSPQHHVLPPLRTTVKPVRPFPRLAMAENGGLTECSTAALPSPLVSPYRRSPAQSASVHDSPRCGEHDGAHPEAGDLTVGELSPPVTSSAPVPLTRGSVGPNCSG